MKGPEPLLSDPESDADEALLLRSARSDQMSEASRQRILAGIGLPGAALGDASDPAPQEVGSAAAANPASLTLGWKAGIGAAIVGAVAGLFLLRDPEPSSERVESLADSPLSEIASAEPAPGIGGPSLSPPLPGPEPASAEPAAPASSASKVYQPSDLPLARARSAPPSAASVGSPPSVSDGPASGKAPADAPSIASTTLADEIAALRAVKARLARGEAAAALAELADYRARFPRASLGQEASMLQVEALVRLGRKREAERLAAPLLENPKSPYRARLRSLLAP